MLSVTIVFFSLIRALVIMQLTFLNNLDGIARAQKKHNPTNQKIFNHLRVHTLRGPMQLDQLIGSQHWGQWYNAVHD